MLHEEHLSAEMTDTAKFVHGHERSLSLQVNLRVLILSNGEVHDTWFGSLRAFLASSSCRGCRSAGHSGG